MPHDVFISYATEDKVTADAVCFGMEKEGIRCWIAPRDILPSDNYDDAIIQAIDNARVMVVIFSSNIFQSQYVKGEVEYAFSRNLIIAPFRIENITPEGGLKLYLGRKHWLDAMTPPLENHIHKLATTINSMLAVPETANETTTAPVQPVEPAARPATQPAPHPFVSPKPARRFQPWWFAGLGLAILVIAVLIIALSNVLKGSGDPSSTVPTQVAASSPVIPTQSPATQAPKSTAVPGGSPTGLPPTQPAPAAEKTAPASTSGSWQLLDSLPRNINDFTVDPVNPKIIFAATGDYTGAGGGVYKSEDSGLNWKPASSGLPNETVLAITVVQGTNPIVLAALEHGGIFASKDAGSSWTSLGVPFSGGGQKLTAFALSKDRKIVFGLVEYLGVVRSDNAGQSWTLINEGLPKQEKQALVKSIAVDPTNPQILYAGTGGFVGQGSGVYKTTNGGESWTAANKGMLDFVITTVAVDPANNQVVYAGSGKGELLKSSDGGQSWTNLTERLKLVPQKEPREMTGIQIDPGTGQVYVVASNSGVLVSADSGNKWRLIGTPPGTNQPQFNCMGIIFGEKPVLLVAIPGVTTANGWRYGEGQVTPSASNQPTPAVTPAKALTFAGIWGSSTDLPRSIRAVAANPANPKQVFAGVNDPSGSGGLYQSVDGGLTWQKAAGWTGKGVSAIAFSGGTSPTVYAVSDFGGEIYYSLDSGSTWKITGKPPIKSSFTTSLVSASSDAKVVYFVTDPGLTHSDDGGQSWQTAGEGLPMDSRSALVLSVAIDPVNPSIVYAGTGGFVGQGQGVYKSTDGGNTWTPANRGMLDYSITALAVDPHQPQVVFAGSYMGDLFKSSDAGLTWTNLTEKLKVTQYGDPRKIHSIQIDPITGIIFLAADNSGVLYSSDGGGKWRALGNPSSLNQPYWTDFSMTFGEKPVMFFATEDKGMWRFAPNP